VSREYDARRIAAGPLPSELVGAAQPPLTHDGGSPPSSVSSPPGHAPTGHAPTGEAPTGAAPTGQAPASQTVTEQAAPFDPLRLCIFATIALLGWAAGPFALVVFAAVGFAGYWKARRAGLTRSKCYLRDTRLVLAYLAVLTAAGLWGIYSLVV
jgi:hypothetical protein